MLGLVVALMAFVAIPDLLSRRPPALLQRGSLSGMSRAGMAVVFLAPLAGLSLGLLLGLPDWALLPVAAIVVGVVLVPFSFVTERWTADGREHRQRRAERLRPGESRWQIDVVQPFQQVLASVGTPRLLTLLVVMGAALAFRLA